MAIGRWKSGVSGLLLTVAAGCTLRAPYKEPDVKPAAVRRPIRPSSRRRPYDPAWWNEFDDPVLGDLIGATLKANLDVRAAVARLDQARAVFDDVKLRSLSDRHRRRQRRSARAGGARADRRAGRYDDLSRRVRRVLGDRSVRPHSHPPSAPRPRTPQSFDAALDDVRVSVAAEVARNYFELRGVQQQIAVTERSLANARETLRLSQVRRDAGIGEEQDVASAQRARRRRRVEPAAAARGAGASASIDWRC